MLWGMDIINTMVFFSIGVLMPVWEEDLGVTPIEAGLLGSAGFLGFGLTALPAAIWVTRYNPRLVALAGAVGMTFFVAVQAFAPNVELLLLGRFGFTIMTVVRIQVQVIFIQQWFKPNLYPTANSLDFGARSGGQVIALGAIPVLVVLAGGWRELFVGVGVVMAGLSIAWALFGRQRPQVTQRSEEMPRKEGNPARLLRRNRTIWIMAASQIGAAMAFASFMSFYPTYAIDRSGISLTTIGFIMSLFPIGAVLGTLSVGPLSQAMGRRKPFIWAGGLALPVIYLALLWVEDPVVMMPLLFMGGVFAMAVPPTLGTITFDLSLQPRELSVAMALTRTLFPIGATLGPIFVGTLEEMTGSLFLGLGIVAPAAVTLFIGGVLLPETGPKGLQKSAHSSVASGAGTS